MRRSQAIDHVHSWPFLQAARPISVCRATTLASASKAAGSGQGVCGQIKKRLIHYR